MAQQEFDVRGTVANSAGIGLQNAMIVALSREDSVLVKHALTNSAGSFIIEDLPAGAYILQVTLIGHGAIRSDFEVADADVDLGTVTLSMEAIEVDSLVVTIEQVPFVNRRDTLGYNAAAFETPPNATVEDLLQRLPGVEVADDGTITVQGEEVQNILVDGKEFFGGDGAIATRNLPADAIKLIDVYDKQSDMAEFSGIADGNEERTINLKLREEAKVGYFGRTRGAFGSDMNNQARFGGSAGNAPRYEGALSLNRFSPSRQYALVANANNVNRAGFSLDGGGGGRGGGGGGFNDTKSFGVNVSNDFGDDNWLRSSYFYSEVDNERNSTVQQQALLGSDVSSLVDRLNTSHSGNRRHRVNLNGQIEPSEGHRFRLRVNGSFESSNQASFSSQETHNAGGGRLHSAVTNRRVDERDLDGDARLTWRKRLGESGRTMSAEFRSEIADYDQTTELASELTGPEDEAGAGLEETFQERLRVGRRWNNRVRLSLTQPLGEGRLLEVFARRSSTSEDRDNPVYDIVDETRVLNERRSRGFERLYTYHYAGARFNRNNDRYRFVSSVRVQRSSLDGELSRRDDRIKSAYTHVYPNLDFRIELKEGHNFSLRYNTSTREPSLTQLQPFVDNTYPLNIYVGNPGLEPEYRHRINADYRFFDRVNFRNLFTFANFTYTRNTIAQSRSYDERGIQTRSPFNTDASWSTNAGANFGTPIQRLGVEVDLEYRLSYSEGMELINHVANDNRSVRNSLELALENRSKDRLDLRVGGDFSFNNVRYSLNDRLDRDYLDKRYFANATVYASDAWTIRSTLSYRVYDRNLYGSNQSRFAQPQNVARWDASVLRRVLENRVELELRGYDLLNQSQGVRISNNSNFIQESRTQSLGQYFLVRVMYRLGNRLQRGGRGRRG